RRRRTGMAVEEAHGGHHQRLGILGMLGHPRLAWLQEHRIGGVADADEAETPGFVERRQPR
ncbi:hypothetical protein chiPu_0029346, partial [Chiloscyllium punctatum]|nr:hypothetical protein [Chiloscyllium punctatum]